MVAHALNHFPSIDVQSLLVQSNAKNLGIFCARATARMYGVYTKSLLIFTLIDLSDRERMIQASIFGLGKSFLASIVLALFVFGVIQMLTRT